MAQSPAVGRGSRTPARVADHLTSERPYHFVVTVEWSVCKSYRVGRQWLHLEVVTDTYSARSQPAHGQPRFLMSTVNTSAAPRWSVQHSEVFRGVRIVIVQSA